MIANKALPSFYVIELEGDSADLKFLLGSSHKIESITISSLDFNDDVSAINAANDVINLFKRKLDLKIDEEQIAFNPEFFPSQPAIEPTLEMLVAEQEAEDAIEEIEEERQRMAFPMTRRFDEWGDFVVAKTHLTGQNFDLLMKVTIHPQKYFEEKSLEIQEHKAYLQGQKYKDGTSVIH